MSQIVSDNLLAGLYLVMWIFTFIWYHRKNTSFDAGSTILLTYILYAIFSLTSINDQLFSVAYNPLRLFPYIYLYLMIMIAMTPITYFHNQGPNTIKDPKTRIFSCIVILIFICSVLLIPDIIKDASSGILQLFTDADAGKDAYMEQVEEATESGGSISNIPAIIYNSLSDITVFLCFYLMTRKEHNKKYIFMLLFAIIIGILLPITKGQRGGVVSGVLTVIGGYMLFKKYISDKLNRLLKYAGIILFTIITIPIIAITVSRFGKETGGVGGFINWYVGQGSLYFNNYGLNAGGTRNGDRTFNLVKRVIKPDTPKNFSERRDKYRYLKIDDYFFTTFVGDFTIDFGPIGAAVIFIIVNLAILIHIRTMNDEIAVHQLLLIFFAICVNLQGGMTLYSYADSGNLRILMLGLIYSYLRYHEILEQKFPLILHKLENDDKDVNCKNSI